MVVAQGGYTFKDAWATPRLGLEYAYGSGDSDPTDGKHETFDNLFPTNHKFYGYMDFLSLQNLHDVRGIFSSSRTRGSAWLWRVMASGWRIPMTVSTTSPAAPRGGVAATPSGNGYGINPSYSSFVGTELDFIAGYALTRLPSSRLATATSSPAITSAAVLSAPTHGSTDADYVYIQASINF